MVGKMLPSGETGNGRGRDKSNKRDERETIDFLCPVANAQYFFYQKMQWYCTVPIVMLAEVELGVVVAVSLRALKKKIVGKDRPLNRRQLI